MLRCIGVAMIALACTVTAAEARPRVDSHNAAHCVLDNSGRQICQGHVNRISRASVGESGIVPHPAGCPRRAFCGCGVSVRVFGKPVRDLFLAANWRKFPRTSPTAGMVAARPGHVFYIESYNGDGTALAYDPNSGNHRTRIHVRSIKGYVIVNPHAQVAGL